MIKNIDIYISSIYIHLLKSAEMIENEYANGNNMTGGFYWCQFGGGVCCVVRLMERVILVMITDGKRSR